MLIRAVGVEGLGFRVEGFRDSAALIRDFVGEPKIDRSGKGSLGP